MTRYVTRRSWGEGRVRFWWMSAVVIAIVGAIVTVGYVREAMKRKRLLETGITVKGKLIRVEGVSAKDNPNWKVLRDHSVAVEISIVLPDGQLATLTGDLPAGRGYLAVSGDIDVRVDRNDLTNWGESVQPTEWWEVVAFPLIFMLPIVVLLLAIAEWHRRRVIKVWRDGMRAAGVVTDVRHSAAAPHSRVVHFTLAEGPERRVFKTLYPARAGIPQRGDALTLLLPADRPQDAIVADLFVRPNSM